MEETITPGLVGEARILVTEEQTARHLGSGGVSVFATPAMVRLMEEAAVKPWWATCRRASRAWVSRCRCATWPRHHWA